MTTSAPSATSAVRAAKGPSHPPMTVIAYCTSVSCNASTKGALRLSQLGIPVKEMLGGLRAWEAEGYPVERGQ
jgi:rhodanese-related sulfurtransferase